MEMKAKILPLMNRGRKKVIPITDKSTNYSLAQFQEKLTLLKTEKDIIKLEENVNYIQTVGSKLAQFYILNTKLYNPEMKLKDIAERWFNEIEGPLNKIVSATRKNYFTKEERANYFVTHVLFYLLVGKTHSRSITLDDINAVIEDRPCPFLKDAWNYISILMKTNKC
jgi:hypothetical protein